MLSGDASLGHPVADFASDLAISTVLGIVAGVVLSATISSHRAGIWRDSAPIAVLAVVAISYVSLDSAGGSGYLGSFLAGLVVGNMEQLGLAMHSEHEQRHARLRRHACRRRHRIRLPDHRREPPFDALVDDLLPGLAVSPCSCSSRGRSPSRLRGARPPGGVVASRARVPVWTRETGVVPAALVGVLAGLHVPHGDILSSVVAIAIIVTLLAQALPAPWLAARLGLLDGPTRTRTSRPRGRPRSPAASADDH